MANYRVVLEMELDADSPLEAAKTLQGWLKEDGDGWQYYVQSDESDEIFSVDLQEEDEDAVLPVKDYKPLIEIK